jgi:5-dehydro-4-deoxyglucarate dehydratase
MSDVAIVRSRLESALAAGVLSFPLTAFDDSGAIDSEAFRVHLRHQLDAEPGALFACCGTGEFFSLAEDEYATLVAVAVEAGADAGLLMPPYLVETSQAGIVAHVREVTSRTSLPLIVYQRAQVTLSVSAVRELADIESILGVKDAHGDLDQVLRLRLAAPGDWLFFNGVATAEMQAQAYASIGVPAYSSAVHAFAPEIARRFFQALHRGDDDAMEELLRRFYLPLVELRDRGTGYAVSLIKAAARMRGAPVGPVRAPLTDPTPEHLRQLEQVLAAGLEVVGAT